jgi:hypothetical protein
VKLLLATFSVVLLIPKIEWLSMLKLLLATSGRNS